MDTSQDINTVEWFFGYGGNHLGLKRVLPNLRLLAACEIEEFAVENILAKMEAGLLEAAPIWSDCKTFPWEPFVDRTHLFVASYPCQPFSAAGKRQGTEDERHLWPYVYRWILRARPLLVFLENVEGHVSLGLSTVISDLEEGGYKATWGIFSASEVGAPHQRKRVFILAYRHGERGQLPDWWREPAEQVPVGYGEARRDGGMGNASSAGHSGPAWSSSECAQGQSVGHAAESNGGVWPSRPGEQQHAWEPPRVVGAVPAKLADFCSMDQQPRHDAAPAGGQGVGPGQQSQDADADGGSGLCGGDQETGTLADTGRNGRRQDESRRESQGRVAAEWDGEAMGNASSQRPHRGTQDGLGFQPEMSGERYEAMGNATHTNRRPRVSAEEAGAGQDDIWRRRSGESGERQTQPPLGRDADGPTHRLDHAELYTTCDNRTDELRLLGNGVVPAVAERAFRLLVSELMEHQP